MEDLHNHIINQEDFLSSTDSDSEDSSDNEGLFSNNIGINYTYTGHEERLLDDKIANDHINIQTKYFTPEISKHNLIVDIGEENSKIINFKKDYNVYDNVIGFKIIKGLFNCDISGGSKVIDIVIDEIPHIACKQHLSRKHIIDRIHVVSTTFKYYENKNLFQQNYFHPIKLSKLSIQIYMNQTLEAFNAPNNSIEFEITQLNHTL
mgnify:FL=1